MANFFSQFITNPRKVGTPFRCSKDVGEKMAAAANLQEASVVVEFGPGTGVITGEIQKQLAADTLFFAIEINPKLAEKTRVATGATVYVDSCANVSHYLSENGHSQCDAIICTIPWAMMDAKDAVEVMDAVENALKPGGRFITVGLIGGRQSPGGRRLKKMMTDRFTSVKMSKNIWSNIPPAFYYTCVK